MAANEHQRSRLTEPPSGTRVGADQERKPVDGREAADVHED